MGKKACEKNIKTKETDGTNNCANEECIEITSKPHNNVKMDHVTMEQKKNYIPNET